MIFCLHQQTQGGVIMTMDVSFEMLFKALAEDWLANLDKGQSVPGTFVDNHRYRRLQDMADQNPEEAITIVLKRLRRCVQQATLPVMDMVQATGTAGPVFTGTREVPVAVEPWFTLLKRLTCQDPVHPKHWNNDFKAAQDWVQWGVENSHIDEQ